MALPAAAACRNISEYLPYVDLGECLGVRCADTGVAQDPKAVRAGRLREITQVAEHGTWDYVPAEQCRGKVVKMRWVDRIDRKSGGVKSRLCAMEFAWDLRGDTFAGTPPLTAVRMVVSFAATGHCYVIMVTDIICAFLHASMDGEAPIFVVVPPGLGPAGMRGAETTTGVLNAIK